MLPTDHLALAFFSGRNTRPLRTCGQDLEDFRAFLSVEAVDSAARILLSRRYGAAGALAREPPAPPWRGLRVVLHQREARDELHGDRCAAGLTGTFPIDLDTPPAPDRRRSPPKPPRSVPR